jgi:hypothetical protein
MNKQNEMKQMIRNGGKEREKNGWISKMRWNKWLNIAEKQRNLMNKQIEMKQMIGNGGNDRENGWISKMRWKKWLEIVEKTEKYDE